MTDLADAIPFLAIRARELASLMVEFALDRRIPGGRPRTVRRRAVAIATRCRALAAAMGLADGDDVLTAAKELADLELLSDELLDGDVETLRPPPSASGTFVVERQNASTNRLWSQRGAPTPSAS